MDKFTKQKSVPNELEEHPTNGTAELTQSKQFKRPPTIKPKPCRTSLPLQTGREQAPPLPVKRTRTLQKQKGIVGGEEGDGISVEGGRSGTVDCCCTFLRPVCLMGFGIIIIKVRFNY